ncbi:MAG: polysaccharide pyruvyl transferase CsaB [Candidatus Eremiobacteraeota bacterium]|nr:polysaccharide pyruvyl transferase CsaB [Candidatus Eremiobacteraeota bacterium]
MRLLVSGYYGFGNLGDEAILQVTVDELRRRHPALEIDVLSARPPETARELGVAATPRMVARAVGRAIQAADVVASGGGGLLQNATSTRSLLYYAAIIRQAAARGKPAMIFAQSIGPLDFLGRRIVTFCCRRVRRATVRDERSRVMLSRLLPGVPIERTADPVWLVAKPEASFDLEAEGLGSGSEPLAVVCVRKIPRLERGVPVIAAVVDRLAERGAKVAFLPLGGASDAEASTAIIRACRSAPTLLPAFSLQQAVSVIARAEILIGMRLHAPILAGVAGVPFIAIPYDPKVTALCEELAWPLPPLWDPQRRSGDIPAALKAVDRLWDEREELRAHLSARVPRMQDLAKRNFDVLDELLDAQN